jgi:murein L,D-transpeptidase YafK
MSGFRVLSSGLLALLSVLEGAAADEISGVATPERVVFSPRTAVGAAPERADHVVVDKSDRKLYLLRAGRVLREFNVSLGLVPNGPKQREGDFRTPEGKYVLDARNVDSDYFLSIHVSYPNEADRERARVLGVDPGGQIMIHGLPNEPKYDLRSYQGTDWTDGCIAVSNADMIDIWLMTRESTPIEIRP